MPSKILSCSLSDQIDRLIELGMPSLTGMDPIQFRVALEQLGQFCAASPSDLNLELGRLPFVVVVEAPGVALPTFPRIERRGKCAIEQLRPKTP